MDYFEPITPAINIKLYNALYVIEVGLRELIIEQFDAEFGTRWIRQQLPGGADVQNWLKEARSYERQTPWISHIPHHPIYYLDFPQLKQTIERNDNWERVFRALYQRKDIVIGALSQIEPIRNKVAHNRRASTADLSIVESTFTVLEAPLAATMGPNALLSLASRFTAAPDLALLVARLHDEARVVRQAIVSASRLDQLSEWQLAEKAWWLSDEYLGTNTAPIRKLFELAKEYAALPRARGTGHLIESWIRESDLESVAEQAFQVFNSLH